MFSSERPTTRAHTNGSILTLSLAKTRSPHLIGTVYEMIRVVNRSAGEIAEDLLKTGGKAAKEAPHRAR